MKIPYEKLKDMNSYVETYFKEDSTATGDEIILEMSDDIRSYTPNFKCTYEGYIKYIQDYIQHNIRHFNNKKILAIIVPSDLFKFDILLDNGNIVSVSELFPPKTKSIRCEIQKKPLYMVLDIFKSIRNFCVFISDSRKQYVLVRDKKLPRFIEKYMKLKFKSDPSTGFYKCTSGTLSGCELFEPGEYSESNFFYVNTISGYLQRYITGIDIHEHLSKEEIAELKQLRLDHEKNEILDAIEQMYAMHPEATLDVLNRIDDAAKLKLSITGKLR